MWVAGLIAAFAHAQNMNDVFHYNQSGVNGTARYMATSGVISQIGADLSAVADNPAGAAAFVANRISWTPTAFNNSNTGIYNGNARYSDANSIFSKPFYTNQWGVALPYVSDQKKWNKIAFGITGRADYHYLNRIKAGGEAAAMQSLAHYFAYQADGVPTADLQIYEGETVDEVYRWLGENYGSYAQQAFLAYQAYVIDPASDDSLNSAYVTNAYFSHPLTHGIDQTLEGKKFSHDVFFAAEYDKKLSVGVSLTIRKMNFTNRRTITETGYDSDSPLQYMQYATVLENEAGGLQMKFGLLYKAVKNLKIGLSYHSPTWWENEETTRESLHTEVLDIDDLDNDNNTNEINVFDIAPQVENVYDKYTYMEPGRWQAGFSYTFPKTGFIAADYTYRDWRMTHFSDPDGNPDDQAYFDYLNDLIKETYTAQHRIRVGGELKLQEWAVRLGMFNTTSPFKNAKEYGTRGYSFGLGYDFGNLEVDLGWIHSKKKYREQLFPVGLTTRYSVTNIRNKYVVTFRYNF